MKFETIGQMVFITIFALVIFINIYVFKFDVKWWEFILIYISFSLGLIVGDFLEQRLEKRRK